MPTEIERKFLVKSEAWREGPPGVEMRQGYLARNEERSVRVRVAGDKAFITVKGRGNGISRAEFEYPVPLEDAREMLGLCLPSLIEKTRYERDYGGHTWEVDEFHGDNAGLIVAEIELDAEEREFEKPEWVGEEVTHDSRYLNACLAERPWRDWGKAGAA